MEISLETKDLVKRIDAFSNHKLKHPETLCLLLELARANDQNEKIEKIAFLSKFLWNAYGILKRSNSETEGYEKLTSEFKGNLEKFISRVKELIEAAPSEEKQNLSSTFLATTGEGFENLISLVCDFSWVKNWYIDQKASTRGVA